ncbi:hypothetical protein C8J57DRAFT_1480846 [Mycena rebaudengoi]|nr:hypothetical protein C8J57DRAFT_1480846 [Mycena rebaudengoi]
MKTAQRVKENKEDMHFCCFIAISASDAARSGHKNDRARVWLLFAPSSHLPRLRGRPDTGDGAEHEQFSETLNTILTFVRSQVKGGFWRCIFRSMEAADFITECNTGLKHALDVFGVHLAGSPITIYPNLGLQVQSGIIAAVTMAEVQKDASKRYEELIAILDKTKCPKRSSDSSSSGGSHSSSRKKKRHPSTQLTRSSTLSLIPASPNIFHGRDEELKHVANTMLHAPAGAAAHIVVVGPDGVVKTHSRSPRDDPQIRERFAQNRFFVDCTAAGDRKQLISLMAAQLGLEEPARQKTMFNHFTATATAEAPALVVLDAIGRAWKPFEYRNDVEDFLSLLADLQHVTVIVTLRSPGLVHISWDAVHDLQLYGRDTRQMINTRSIEVAGHTPWF